MGRRLVRWNGSWTYVSGAQAALTVTTNGASNHTDSSMTLDGEVTDLGDHTADVWFDWGESGTGLSNSTAVETLDTTGTFSHSITGLNADTTYEFQAQAENTNYEVSDSGTVETSSTLTSGSTPASVQNNMDTWWPMDDGSGSSTITDAVGSRDLTVTGSPTLNSDHISWSGTSGDRLVDSNSAGSFYGGQTAITYFGWFYVPSGGSGQTTMASLYDTTNDDRSWYFRVDWANTRTAFNVSDDGVNFNTQRYSSLPPTDQWVSLAFTADTSSDDYVVYVDGNAQTMEWTATGQLFSPAIDFWIGDSHHNTYEFNGDMRECGFAQTALDATTIQQIHNDTGP